MSALTSAIALSWSSVSTKPNEDSISACHGVSGPKACPSTASRRRYSCDQLRGHLAGRGPRLGPGALPVRAAHLRQRRRLAAAVGGDGLDLVDREVEAVRAPVLQDQVVPGGPAHGPRRHALEAGHAVLAVDDEAPGLEVVEEPVRRPGPRAGPPVRHPPAR